MSATVQVVIINWKRPRNVETIVNAFREGTVSCPILIADCHPEPQYALSPDCLSKVDSLFTIRENLGPSSRFIPALANSINTEYTYFHDDDAVPGKNCLESYLNAAALVKDFSVIGQVGRTFRLRPSRPEVLYFSNNTLRHQQHFMQVDSTVRFHLVRNTFLHYIVKFRNDYARKLPDHLQFLSEDDLVLNMGLQLNTGFPSYLMPITPLDDASNVEGLTTNDSFSARPHHIWQRRQLVNSTYLHMGWQRVSPNSALVSSIISPEDSVTPESK